MLTRTQTRTQRAETDGGRPPERDSFEALRSYARDSDRLHFPAWQDYYQDGIKDDAALGIWHETYVVDPDDYETVYNNMPPHGLGASRGTELERADGQRNTAAGRIGQTDGTDAPNISSRPDTAHSN